jgi:predicted kinase
MDYEKELILMVGPIGSGKTTFAKSLVNDSAIRISQDEMGRKAYLKYFHEALKDGVPRIIIDRMGFDREQRNRFIEPARKHGYVITIFEMDYNPVTCLERVINREGHPTIPKGSDDLARKIILDYMKNYEHPEEKEFDNYSLIGINDDTVEID